MIKFTLITKKNSEATYTSIEENEFMQLAEKGMFARPSLDQSICFASFLKKLKKKISVKEFNGLVLLEVTNLPSETDAIKLREEASRIPYTRIAFVCDRTLKIVCQFTWNKADKELTDNDYQLLQSNAYKKLHYHYSSQLMLTVDNDNKPSVYTETVLYVNPGVYYNPNCMPLLVTTEDIEVPEFKGDAHKYNKVKFGDNDYISLDSTFEWCLSEAVQKARQTEENSEDVNNAALSYLADFCCESNIPIDFAIMHSRWKSRFNFDENYIKEVFNNAYEVKQAASIPYPHVDKNALMVYKTEAFIKMHYELRRNVMTGVVQYRAKNGYAFEFTDITENVINSMTNNAIKAGIGSWDKDLRRMINSNDIPDFDPLSEFIYSLPQWDGKDRIAEFASRIPSNCENMEYYLRIWFRSMVAHWLGKDGLHGNALVPLFIGDQGCGKSSICGIILPPNLRDYYNDKVDFKNDTALSLGLSSFALINIDEFDSVKRSQQPVLKYLLSKNDVKIRPPYGKSFVNRRRYASFVATTNMQHPLVDITGSRRFICIRIKPGQVIDFTTPIEYKQFYAQIKQEIKEGKRYWLNEDETAKLIEQNKLFQNIPSIAQVVDTLFAHASESSPMSTIDIIEKIQMFYPELEYTNGLNAEVGRVLKAKGFKFKRTNKGVIYYVKLKE